MSLHAAPRPPRTTSTVPDLATLIPWRAWLHHPALRTGPVAVVVLLVVVPPVVLVVARDDTDTAAALFATYFAAAWWLLLRTVLRPGAGLGGLSAIVALIALVTQVPLALAMEELLAGDPENLISGILGVGLPEELVKALPVAVVIAVLRSRGRLLAPRDVLFLGVVSGLVFGAAEATLYVQNVYVGVLGPEGALTVLWRLLANPAIHGAWAGVTCFFIGLAARRDPGQWAPLVGLGLTIAAVLHGFSNVVSMTWAWPLVAAVSIVLLLAYSTVGIADPAPTPPRPVADPPTAPIAFRGPDGRLWA